MGWWRQKNDPDTLPWGWRAIKPTPGNVPIGAHGIDLRSAFSVKIWKSEIESATSGEN